MGQVGSGQDVIPIQKAPRRAGAFPAGAIHYWNLEEAAAGPYLDAIGSDHLLQAFGVGQSQVTGKQNFGLGLNTASVSTNGATMPFGSPHALSFWFDPSADLTLQDIVLQGAPNSSLRINISRQLVMRIGAQTTTGTVVLNNGTFYHIVLNYSNGISNVYLNGALEIANFSWTETSPDALTLWSTSGLARFDEFAWFPFTLSIGQIGNIFNGGAGRFL